LSIEIPPHLFNLYQYISNVNIEPVQVDKRLKKYSYKKFHLALGDILKEKNVKLRGLAARTNLNYTYFSKLKNRKNSPPIKTIKIIASGLAIDPDYFLEYRIQRIIDFLEDNPEYVDDIVSYLEDLKEKSRLHVADPGESFNDND
jgi:transcriptional regulator with XRE-family HTH domain